MGNSVNFTTQFHSRLWRLKDCPVGEFRRPASHSGSERSRLHLLGLENTNRSVLFCLYFGTHESTQSLW